MMAQSKFDCSGLIALDKPRLQHWGKVTTLRIFARYSCIDRNSKKGLLELVNAIRKNQTYVYIEKQNTQEILCCLPYILGFAREVEYLHRVQVDLSKPILFIANTIQDLTSLMKILSSEPTSGKQPFLVSKDILTKQDIQNGAQSHVHVVNESGINFSKASKNSDIVLCSFDNLPYLPHRGFSLVIAQEKWHPTLSGYQVHSSVLVLKCLDEQHSDLEQPQNSLKSFQEPALVHYADMIAKGERQMPVLLGPQIKGIEELLDRVTDFNCNHIPIKVNISGNHGFTGLLHSLPYLLGCAVIRNSKCLDLTKPILFLTTDKEAYQVTSEALQAQSQGLNKAISSDNAYKCSLLSNEFEVCTYNQQIHDGEVVLHSILSTTSKAENEAENNLYTHFHTNNFSAVVVVQSKYLSIKSETEILVHFSGLTTIFVRANVESEQELENGHIWLKPKASTIQYFGAERITPALMVHGRDIAERYLLSQKSILTDCQQVGLAAILDWLESSESNGKPAYITTAIGWKYAGMMVWCLPSILEWGYNNYLLSEGSLAMRKPLLVLCKENETASSVWNLVHSRNRFHQSSLFCSVANVSEDKQISLLVSDTGSAVSVKTLTGQCKIVFSDVQYLEYLPEDGFSVVVWFEKNNLPVSALAREEAMKKYTGYSKLLFLTANPLGPLKKFQLQTGSEFSPEQEEKGFSVETEGLSNVISKPISLAESKTLTESADIGKLSQANNSSLMSAESTQDTSTNPLIMMDVEVEQDSATIELCEHIPIQPSPVSSSPGNAASSPESEIMAGTSSDQVDLVPGSQLNENTMRTCLLQASKVLECKSSDQDGKALESSKVTSNEDLMQQSFKQTSNAFGGTFSDQDHKVLEKGSVTLNVDTMEPTSQQAKSVLNPLSQKKKSRFWRKFKRNEAHKESVSVKAESSSNIAINSDKHADVKTTESHSEETNVAQESQDSAEAEISEASSFHNNPDKGKRAWFKRHQGRNKLWKLKKCHSRKTDSILEEGLSDTKIVYEDPYENEASGNGRKEKRKMRIFKFKSKPTDNTTSKKQKKGIFPTKRTSKSEKTNTELTSWNEPVIYMSSSKTAITKSSAVTSVMTNDVPTKDCVSICSLTWSEPSSIDVVSLTEKGNPVGASSTEINTLENHKLFASNQDEKLKASLDDDLVINSMGPQILPGNLQLADEDTSARETTEHKKVKSFARSLKKSILLRCLLPKTSTEN